LEAWAYSGAATRRFAAEQLVDGHVGELALDVPQAISTPLQAVQDGPLRQYDDR
jgi:hypothetical protein